MTNPNDFSQYKEAVYNLKPILEKIKVTDKNYKQILYLLNWTRYQELSGSNIVDIENEFKELVNFLNSLESFKKFQVDVIKSDADKIIHNNKYFLHLKKNKPYQTDGVSKDYMFLREYGDLIYYQEDNVMQFEIMNGFINSDNKLMHKAMANLYSRIFVHNVLSNTKKYYKDVEKEEITKQLTSSLEKLNSHIKEHLSRYDRSTFYPDFLVPSKKEDEKLGLNAEYGQLRVYISEFEKYLPDFKDYLPYLLIPRKIDPLALDVAKEYFAKLGEFDNKIQKEFENSSKIEQQRANRLLDVIFNQVIIINKHQEFAIKEQSKEGQELYDFIVEQLPRRAKNKNLQNKKQKIEFKDMGFSNQVSIEIDCNLKDFTQKNGLTKSLFKSYLKNLKEQETHVHRIIPKTPIYFVEEKDIIKFGMNIVLDDNEELEKDYKDFYALSLLEEVISSLLKYQKVYVENPDKFIDMSNFIVSIDIEKLKREVRTKNLFETLTNIDTEAPSLKSVKKKI